MFHRTQLKTPNYIKPAKTVIESGSSYVVMWFVTQCFAFQVS